MIWTLCQAVGFKSSALIVRLGVDLDEEVFETSGSSARTFNGFFASLLGILDFGARLCTFGSAALGRLQEGELEDVDKVEEVPRYFTIQSACGREAREPVPAHLVDSRICKTRAPNRCDGSGSFD